MSLQSPQAPASSCAVTASSTEHLISFITGKVAETQGTAVFAVETMQLPPVYEHVNITAAYRHSDKLLWWILPVTTTASVFRDASSCEIGETEALLPKVAGSTFIRNVAVLIIDCTESHYSKILSVFIVPLWNPPVFHIWWMIRSSVWAWTG